MRISLLRRLRPTTVTYRHEVVCTPHDLLGLLTIRAVSCSGSPDGSLGVPLGPTVLTNNKIELLIFYE